MKFRIQKITYFYSGRIVYCPMIKKGFWGKWHYIWKGTWDYSISWGIAKTPLSSVAAAKQFIYDYLVDRKILVNKLALLKSIKVKSIVVK